MSDFRKHIKDQPDPRQWKHGQQNQIYYLLMRFHLILKTFRQHTEQSVVNGKILNQNSTIVLLANEILTWLGRGKFVQQMMAFVINMDVSSISEDRCIPNLIQKCAGYNVIPHNSPPDSAQRCPQTSCSKTPCSRYHFNPLC